LKTMGAGGLSGRYNISDSLMYSNFNSH